MEWISDWFTWSNFFYALALIAGTVLTIVSAKYRRLIKDVKELFETIRAANEDNVLTDVERKKIVKEALDVGADLLHLVWKR